MRHHPLRFLALSVLLAFAPLAPAADEVFVTEAGAIRGYDVVAYHTEGKPVPGAADIVHQWNGATWRFASLAHRDLFAADPARYAPRYGGYCAYGTANGYKVSTAPEAFAIVDGVLYLNHNLPVQRTWDKDRTTYIDRADTQWTGIEHATYTSDAATIEAQQARGKR